MGRRAQAGPQCRLVATAAVLEVLIVAVMHVRDAYGREDGERTLVTLRALGACTVIFAAVDLLKTLSCRLLSLRVNSGGLFDMLRVCPPPPRACAPATHGSLVSACA